MKHLMMLLLCAALALPSMGCCLTHGYGAGYGNCGGCNTCPGGACGTPFGYAPGGMQGAYYGGTTTTAGVSPIAPTAYGQPYPTMATVNPLPTY